LLGVLQMGILKGLIFAVGLTLIALMHKLSSPQDSVLGRLPGSGNFVDVARHAEALAIPGLLIFRPNGVLFFANANRVYSRMRELVRTASPPIQAVIVNLEASPEIDVTCLEMLGELRNELHKSGIRLYLARVTDPVHDLFERSGFLDQLDGLIFHGVDSAVSAFLAVRYGEPATSEVPLTVEHE
jgi:sulfate permease, SulP family